MMCAVCMFDGRRQEELIDLKDGQIDQLRQERDAAYAESGRLEIELADAIQERDAALAENEELRAECKRISKEIQMCWYGADNYAEAQRGARHCKRLLEAALNREGK